MGLVVLDSVDIAAHLARAAEAERLFAWQEAWHHYAAAAALAPHEHRIHANQGNVAWLAGQPDQARAAYRRALLLTPDCAVSLRGFGNALRDLGQFAAAERAYAVSRERDPDPITAWHHSQVLIGLERYSEAYAAAELRFAMPHAPVYRCGPFWSGDLAGLAAAQEPLRIWSEQGYGDTLQFIRWIPPLLARLPPRAPVPVLEVEPSLVRLLERGLAWLPRIPRVVAKSPDHPPPAGGPHVSLMSLPHHLGDAPHAGLPPGQPYLRDPAWIRRRGAAPVEGRPLRVGLLWAAGRKLADPFQAREYHQRSLPLETLEQLMLGLLQRGFELVNLQVGPDRSLPAPLQRHFRHELPATMDFADTATYIADLDRLITVDTAMAHLLGALAWPGWVLLPFSADPRWHRGTDRTPWHPGLRLFRQPAPGDWGSVIQAVLAALDAEPAGER